MVDRMNPGRELDALIAEKVFHHEVHKNPKGGWSIGEADYYDSYGEMILFNPLPNYSEDISAAWEVMETLPDLWSLVWGMSENGRRLYAICDESTKSIAGGASAPYAICMAALGYFK
jgi:hypothetical protein